MYMLVDHNRNFFNCGHYPEWVVEENNVISVADGKRYFATRIEAQVRANQLNERSAESWYRFLNDR